MGLGLFIAKTLLERSGAELSFGNAAGPASGAVVEVVWPRASITPPEVPAGTGMGENQRFLP